MMNERGTTKHPRWTKKSICYLVHLGLDDVAVRAVEPAVRGNVLHRRRPVHQLGHRRCGNAEGRRRSAPPADRSTAAAAMLNYCC